tara:strand:+ start:374 stop:928 length:555 start_codon:yes stop_codon:yes gene_type:complete
MELKFEKRLFVFVVVFALSSGFHTSPSSAEATHPPCLAYGSTYDGHGHYSLMKSDSFMIGTRLMVESNCGYGQIKLNNVTINYFENITVIDLPIGENKIELLFNERNFVFNNVTIYPSTNVWQSVENPEFYDPNSQYLTGADLSNKEIMVSFGTGLILWVLVTMILWRIINAYVDKNLCEEVRA